MNWIIFFLIMVVANLVAFIITCAAKGTSPSQRFQRRAPPSPNFVWRGDYWSPFSIADGEGGAKCKTFDYAVYSFFASAKALRIKGSKSAFAARYPPEFSGSPSPLSFDTNPPDSRTNNRPAAISQAFKS